MRAGNDLATKWAIMATRARGTKPVLKPLKKEWAWILAAVDSCFDLIGPRQHGTANKQAQIPTEIQSKVEE